MLFTTLLRRLIRSPERDEEGRPRRQTPAGSRAVEPRRFVPRLLALEDRSLPSAAAPVALRFSQEPANTILNAPFRNAVKVEAIDQDGNVVTSDNSDVVTLRPAGSLTAAALVNAAPVGLVNGVATFPTSTLSVGTHSLTAVYQGDGVFEISESSVLTQAVNANQTSTALSSSLSFSYYGLDAIFTAQRPKGRLERALFAAPDIQQPQQRQQAASPASTVS